MRGCLDLRSNEAVCSSPQHHQTRSFPFTAGILLTIPPYLQVVEYDGMGSGLSQELPKEIKLMLEQDGGGGRDKAVAFAVEELGLITSNLAKTLKVEGFHLFGHGFGAEVTASPALTLPWAFNSETKLRSEHENRGAVATSRLLITKIKRAVVLSSS